MDGVRVKGECRWCGRKKENNPGDFYHESDCHRRDVLRRKREADPKDWELRDRLERELWQASYTGD